MYFLKRILQLICHNNIIMYNYCYKKVGLIAITENKPSILQSKIKDIISTMG